MLGDQEFQKRAEESITALYEKLGRAADDFDFDVEMNSGALTVELEEPRERFVVSPNAPVRQIWFRRTCRVSSWIGTRGAGRSCWRGRARAWKS